MECVTWQMIDSLHWHPLCTNDFYLVAPDNASVSGCQVCISPISEPISGCRQCGHYNSYDEFVEYTGQAIGDQRLPKLINFKLNGTISGEIAEDAFEIEMSPLCDYSAGGKNYYWQKVLHGASIKTEGTLKSIHAFADIAKELWKLNTGSTRSQFTTADGAYAAVSSFSTRCIWITGELTLFSRGTCHPKGFSFTKVACDPGDLSALTCGASGFGVGAPGPRALARNGASQTVVGIMTAGEVQFISGEIGRIDSGVVSYAVPQRAAEYLLHALYGDTVLSATLPSLTLVPGNPTVNTGAWRDGNSYDALAAALGEPSPSAYASAGDSSAVVGLSTYHWYTTGDPDPYSDPTYYSSTNCRSDWTHRRYLNINRSPVGYMWKFVNGNGDGSHPGYIPPIGGGNAATLGLYAVFADFGVSPNIAYTHVTKRGYPSAPSSVGTVITTDHGGSLTFGLVWGGDAWNNRTLPAQATGECASQSGSGSGFHESNSAISTYCVTTSLVLDTPDQELGLSGCCNRWHLSIFGGLALNPAITAAANRLPIGSFNLTTDQRFNGSMNWINAQWWPGNILNIDCSLFTETGTYLTFDAATVTELQSKQAHYAHGGVTNSSQLTLIAQYRVTKSLAHCHKKDYDLKLIWAYNAAYGNTFTGAVAFPQNFPTEGSLWFE